MHPFITEFAERLKEKNLCFYVYGSQLEADTTVPTSDVDGGIIIDSDIVTPKKDIMEIAQALADAQKIARVPLDINLTDRVLNVDGRFLSYTSDYTDWIRARGKVIAGENFKDEMRGLFYKSGPLNAIAMNLRSCRNSLLHALDVLENDPAKFREGVEKTIERTIKAPKKLVWLRTGEVCQSNEKAAERLTEFLPKVPIEELKRLRLLRKEKISIDALLKNPMAAIET